MARAFDAHAELLYKWQEAKDMASKIRKELKDVENEQALLQNLIIQKMQNSTEATIAGLPAFEIVDRSRRATSVKAVETVCPHLYDELVTIHTSKTIKVL